MLKRFLAFTTAPPRQQSFNPYMLVKVRLVNGIASAQQLPILPLLYLSGGSLGRG